MTTFIGIVLIVAAVFLIVAILLQSGKEKGMSGAIGGSSSSDTYYGKNKANSRDYILNKLTIVVAIVFAVLVVVSFVIQDDGAHNHTTGKDDFVSDLQGNGSSVTTTVGGSTSEGDTTEGATTTPEVSSEADTTTGDNQ